MTHIYSSLTQFLLGNFFVVENVTFNQGRGNSDWGSEEPRYCSDNLASLFCFFKKIIYLFIYFCFWLCWVFVSVWGLSLVVASEGHSSSWCAGLSLSRPLLLWSTGSRCAGSVVVAHGPSSSAACGIFQDQGSNLCPLHWQADSQPLRHQGNPGITFDLRKK